MSLWDSEYTAGVKDLLQCLDAKNLQALASTATNNRIMATNTMEAVEVILRYTENLGRFFSYRRITSQVLFDYLHKKKLPFRVGESKVELIERVKKDWENSCTKKQPLAIAASSTINTQLGEDVVNRGKPTPTPLRQPAPTDINGGLNTSTAGVNTTVNINLTSPGVHVNVEVTHGQSGSGVRSDVFVQAFCNWFYTMMNRLQPEVASIAGDTFSPDVFMANCSMNLYLYGSQTMEKHASGQHDTYLLLKDVCTDYRLCFVPRLDTGVRAEMSDHGLLRLFCCGTLHQGDAMVGVFEQEFGLVRCPQGQWKIMMTKINLKQAQSSASLPELTKGPVFDII